METKNALAIKNEYDLKVENVSVKLLVNRNKNSYASEAVSGVSHSHLYNELFVCHSGEIDIMTDEGIITLSKDDAAIVPPNMTHHKINTSEEDNWDSVGFTVIQKSVSCNINLYNKLKPICEDGKVAVFKGVPEICRQVKEMHRPLPERIEYLPTLELVSVLSKLSALKPKSLISENKIDLRTPDVYRMAWFEDIVHTKFCEPLTVGMVAEMLNISPRQLSRILKQRYGSTFHRILSGIRLESAANLLISTDHSVQTVLSNVGYTNSTLFYKEFSAKFGMTPTEYRSKNTKLE
ncbi:MAG: AraC family transcriptional regulator [Clostridia bacterium]|nr:AraC family transcriptional regulator [Clostridia bacterium]